MLDPERGIWGTIVGWIATALGGGAFVTGAVCLVQHLMAGDLFSSPACAPGENCHSAISMCLALLAGGAGVASPGFNAVKGARPFSRPAAQQTGPRGEKR